MAHLVEELRVEAERAIAAMRAAAEAARVGQARAELLRHMVATAAKHTGRPRGAAVEAVVAEWLRAWHLDRATWPHVEAEMMRLTDACCDYAASPGPDTDARVRAAWRALEAALEAGGTSLADQMAWRSMCAHGWWELVRPAPPDLPGRAERPTVPRPVPGTPFWATGCAPECRGEAP
jgi:hypothetical protein